MANCMAIKCVVRSLFWNRPNNKMKTDRRMIFRLLWLMWCVCLVSGGILSQSRAFADERASSHEGGTHRHGHEGSESGEPHSQKVEIVMREGAYHVQQGGQSQSNAVVLVAGELMRLSVRNEDSVAHEVISPLFMRADIHIEGKGIGLFRKEAGGFRLNPGDAVTTQFTVPFFEFESFYDLIWCARHGNHAVIGQELVVVRTQTKAGGK